MPVFIAGDRVHFRGKADGDPLFHRRVLRVTQHRDHRGVWCQWSEKVEGQLVTLGNWFDEKDLVKAPRRKGKKKS